MQITLKPVSAPELADIVIGDSLFAIGRHEQPFANFAPELSEKLSRRHARLFEQDGAVYLVDLGSLNGTTIAGQRIGKEPVPLQDGDEIGFAGLKFRIEIRATSPALAGDIELILRAEDESLGLEPIVVTQFPFLINQGSDVFSRYKDRLPADLSYISRRHAHFFLRNRQLYIEDLGSTNGTYVDGQRLEEHACLLREGSRVAFGGNKFSYRVELVDRSAEAAAPTEVMAANNDFTRTTFVTTANSFLDIFCCEHDEPAVESVPAAAPTSAPPRRPAPPAPGLRGWPARTALWLTQIRDALAEKTPQPVRAQRKWLAGAAAVVAIALSGLWYWRGEPERSIRHLLEGGEYAEAATRATVYLRDHPDAAQIEPLAAEAMLKAIVPAWLAQISVNRFDAAQQALEKTRVLAGFDEGKAQLTLLQWITDIERFMHERGGADAPVVMFEQEARITGLLDRWEKDSTDSRQRLETIAHQVPEFAALRAQVFSHVRTLHGLKALELVAIERLGAAIDTALRDDKANALPPVLDDFATRYPRILGVEKLRADLQRYLILDAAREQREWVVAAKIAQDNAFATPPFRAQAERLQREQLPDRDFVAQYDGALDAWQQGRFDDAAGALDALAKSRWGEEARRELERENTLRQDYAALQAAKTRPDYEEQLLAFYGALDPQRDRAFTQTLATEVRDRSSSALAKAESAYKAARAGWDRYRNSGGIGGLQRLAPSIGNDYRLRAGELSQAYRNISSGARTYRLLNRPLPAEWTALETEIANEVRLQRRSLAELSMVLKPGLSKAKLDLLPVLDEPAPGANLAVDENAPGTAQVRSP